MRFSGQLQGLKKQTATGHFIIMKTALPNNQGHDTSSTNSKNQHNQGNFGHGKFKTAAVLKYFRMHEQPQ